MKRVLLPFLCFLLGFLTVFFSVFNAYAYTWYYNKNHTGVPVVGEQWCVDTDCTWYVESIGSTQTLSWQSYYCDILGGDRFSWENTGYWGPHDWAEQGPDEYSRCLGLRVDTTLKHISDSGCDYNGFASTCENGVESYNYSTCTGVCATVPCPDAGTPWGGMFTISGSHPTGSFCWDGCEIDGDFRIITDTDISGLETTVYDAAWTGQECTGDDVPGGDTDPPDFDCDEFTRMCEELCRGGDVDVSCTEEEHLCNCDLPPPPFVFADDDGTLRPDQDADGKGSGSSGENDNDGDENPNGTDNDVNGNGTPNSSDPDVDGDGIGNGGKRDSWTPDGGPDPDGKCADDDIDGDGLKNWYDTDMDGDGISNPNDPDMDGDGVLNDEDSDSDGDCINDDGSSPSNGDASTGTTGDNYGNGSDGSADGDGASDTDSDGVEDTYTFDGGEVDFTPLVNASNSLRGKFPVNLVDSVPAFFQGFLSAREAPSFVIPLSAGNLNIDLSMFDEMMTFFRILLSALMIIGIILVIIRQWSN